MPNPSMSCNTRTWIAGSVLDLAPPANRSISFSAAAVQALALRAMADRLEHNEAVPEELPNVSFIAG